MLDWYNMYMLSYDVPELVPVTKSRLIHLWLAKYIWISAFSLIISPPCHNIVPGAGFLPVGNLEKTAVYRGSEWCLLECLSLILLLLTLVQGQVSYFSWSYHPQGGGPPYWQHVDDISISLYLCDTICSCDRSNVATEDLGKYFVNRQQRRSE